MRVPKRRSQVASQKPPGLKAGVVQSINAPVTEIRAMHKVFVCKTFVLPLIAGSRSLRRLAVVGLGTGL